MKLSKREKILILILIVTVLLYISFEYASNEKIFNLEILKEEYNEKLLEYNDMSKNILLRSTYEENIEELTTEINGLNYLSELQQEKVIVFLNNYLANNGINTNNINFTDLEVVTIDQNGLISQTKVRSTLEIMIDDISNTADKQDDEVNETGQTDENVKQSQDTLTVKALTAYVSFESTYENMIKFIDAIQNNEYEILITNINLSSNFATNTVTGSATITFYAVPKLDECVETNTDWIWQD